MDLVSTGFIFSDTGKWNLSAETETTENGVYAFVAMLLYTSRGFIVLLYNIVLLILILNSIFTQVYFNIFAHTHPNSLFTQVYFNILLYTHPNSIFTHVCFNIFTHTHPNSIFTQVYFNIFTLYSS